jgi:hypothetical protein
MLVHELSHVVVLTVVPQSCNSGTLLGTRPVSRRFSALFTQLLNPQTYRIGFASRYPSLHYIHVLSSVLGLCSLQYSSHIDMAYETPDTTGRATNADVVSSLFSVVWALI